MAPVSPQTVSASKGDIFCRPANEIDVAKFFLLNYGLHALTVITEPGSGALLTTVAIMQALLSPYLGMVKALQIIARFARFRGPPLQQAHYAKALCMAVPQGVRNKEFGHRGNTVSGC
jgi:hypothetical protein